ncbi:MAG: transmembrane 9 family protein [Acidobacteria bacterium]|nr:transmembrane 9 family protein [Acidobacteriota bacterium]
MKPEEHNKTLGVLHLVYGGLQALFVIVASFFAIPAFYVIWNEPGRTAPPLAFALMVFGGLLALSLFFFAPALVAGYGLLKRKGWARAAGIVAAILMALNAPFGTALAIYTLWFLLGSGARLYEDESARFARYALGDAPPTPTSEWFDKEREREYAPPVQPPDWR